MSRYSALQCEMCPFDNIIIIRGVDKTSELNKDKGGGGGGLHLFGLNGYCGMCR